MLTTVIQVQQGISDKACENLGTLLKRSWMHMECRPPPNDENMSPPSVDEQRPQLQRVRSNSVPIALSLMDCTIEEAGLIFSAAEKASARRRKAQSVDHIRQSPRTNTPSSRAVGTPLYEDAEEEQDAEQEPQSTRSREVATPSPLDSEDTTPVVTPTIKTYNDEMVRFVKQRLQNIAEAYCAPPQPRSAPKQMEEEPIWPTTPQRPQLRSHFSNWSTVSTPDERPDAVDLAPSPPATEDSIDDDSDDQAIEKGYAHIVQLRQGADLERSSSPSYFSWPARHKGKPPAQYRFTFDTPVSAGLHVAGQAKSTTPLVDLDASQPDVSRASRGTDFFDFGFRGSGQLTPSPSPVGPFGSLPMHMGQHLPSPQPIQC